MNKVFGTLATIALHTKQNCISTKGDLTSSSRDRKSNASLSLTSVDKKMSRKETSQGNPGKGTIYLPRKESRTCFLLII